LSIIATINDFIDGLLHPSVRGDAMTRARHRAFIAPRLLGSLVLLASVPPYLAVRGAPTAIEVLIVAWLLVPIAIAFFLSRTGELETAHVMSVASFSILLTIVALFTGGIASFAIILLLIVPAGALLSASRRIVATAVGLTLATTLGLFALTLMDMLPQSQAPAHGSEALAVAGVIVTLGYCAMLGFFSETMSRTSAALLNAEEERYRLLARHMSDVISRHRDNGAVDFISPAAETLFALPAADLLGHGLFDRVHVADRPAYLTALSDTARSGEEHSVEFRVRRASPSSVSFVWVEMRCRRLARTGDDAPGASGVVGVMRDISERKAQESALEAARASAQKAEASRSRFLAAMSHELRTPLNAIIGFSELIGKADDLGLDAARRREYAQLINDSGHHLLQVVNGILDMSKMESGTFEIWPEPFLPRPAVVNCCNLMALKARENGVDLVVRTPDELPEMIGDQRAIKQILLNLLSNAIKFTERGGSVTVAAGIEGGRLALRVTDTGVGIGAEDIDRLGDPFFQAGSTYRRKHEGTGLGLSIVKSLVGLHRGEMNVVSRVGEGTTVTIVLPLDLDRIMQKPSATVTPLTPRHDSKADETPADTPVRKRA